MAAGASMSRRRSAAVGEPLSEAWMMSANLQREKDDNAG